MWTVRRSGSCYSMPRQHIKGGIAPLLENRLLPVEDAFQAWDPTHCGHGLLGYKYETRVIVKVGKEQYLLCGTQAFLSPGRGKIESVTEQNWSPLGLEIEYIDRARSSEWSLSPELMPFAPIETPST